MKKSTMKWLVAAVCMLLVVAAVVPSFAGTLGGTTVVGGRDGKDGKDGVDGKDGKDGLTPIFRVNSQTNEWEYSYTGGVSWLSMGVKAGDKYDAFNKLNPEYIDQAWYANFGQKGGGDSIVISNQTLTSGIWSKLQMDIQPGITYDVFINDIVYSCICYEHSDGGYFLGKGSLSGDTHGIESDAPFCIFWPGSYATSGMFFTDSSLSYPLTLKVTDAFVDTYNKLPIEYLPDELLTVADVEELIKNAGSGIDVVAKPGETIIVKEVDESGKPTKWEAVEYQERTHWSELGYIIPETTMNLENGENLSFNGCLVEGETYVVNWNGVDYTCVCGAFTEDGTTFQFIGNTLLLGGEDTGEPFIIVSSIVDGVGMGGIAAVDETVTSFTFSVKGKKYVPIPVQYLTNAFPYYIDVTGSGTDADPYVCNDTVSNVRDMRRRGRPLVVRLHYTEGSNESMFYLPLSMFIKQTINDFTSVMYDFCGFYLYDGKNVRVRLAESDDNTFIAAKPID